MRWRIYTTQTVFSKELYLRELLVLSVIEQTLNVERQYMVKTSSLFHQQAQSLIHSSKKWRTSCGSLSESQLFSLVFAVSMQTVGEQSWKPCSFAWLDWQSFWLPRLPITVRIRNSLSSNRWSRRRVSLSLEVNSEPPKESVFGNSSLEILSWSLKAKESHAIASFLNLPICKLTRIQKTTMYHTSKMENKKYRPLTGLVKLHTTNLSME